MFDYLQAIARQIGYNLGMYPDYESIDNCTKEKRTCESGDICTDKDGVMDYSCTATVSILRALVFFLQFLFTRDEQFSFSTREVRSNTTYIAFKISTIMHNY